MFLRQLSLLSSPSPQKMTAPPQRSWPESITLINRVLQNYGIIMAQNKLKLPSSTLVIDAKTISQLSKSENPSEIVVISLYNYKEKLPMFPNAKVVIWSCQSDENTTAYQWRRSRFPNAHVVFFMSKTDPDYTDLSGDIIYGMTTSNIYRYKRYKQCVDHIFDLGPNPPPEIEVCDE